MHRRPGCDKSNEALSRHGTRHSKCHSNRQRSPRSFLVQVHCKESHRDVRITMPRWDTHQGKSTLHNKPERRLPVTNRPLGI